MSNPFLFRILRVMPLEGGGTKLHEQLSVKFVTSLPTELGEITRVLSDYNWMLGEGDRTTIRHQHNQTWIWQNEINDSSGKPVAKCFITSVRHPQESGSGITFTEVEGGPPERKVS